VLEVGGGCCVDYVRVEDDTLSTVRRWSLKWSTRRWSSLMKTVLKSVFELSENCRSSALLHGLTDKIWEKNYDCGCY